MYNGDALSTRHTLINSGAVSTDCETLQCCDTAGSTEDHGVMAESSQRHFNPIVMRGSLRAVSRPNAAGASSPAIVALISGLTVIRLAASRSITIWLSLSMVYSDPILSAAGRIELCAPTTVR